MAAAINFKDWFSREKISCGLDIGTSAIKIVTLKTLKEKVELNSFDLEHSGDDLGAVLKKLVDASGVKTAGISVSGSSTVVRYADFPLMSEDELKESLKFEAQKYIPFPISEVSLDSFILKDNLPGNRMLILLAAVRKDFISQRVKTIQETGLKIESVDFDSLALVKAFNFNYPREEYGGEDNRAVGLLNVGASSSNLNILEDGIPVFSRDIRIAGNDITQKIQEALALDFESAERLKTGAEKGGLDKASAAIEQVFSDLAEQIRSSFDYYESQSSSSVNRIFLSGGGASFPDLKDKLAGILGAPVDYWDAFKKIEVPGTLDAGGIKALSAQMAVAVGLALPK